MHDDRAYKTYSAGRVLRLARPVLDCGHPNDDEVYSHIWCDRLACRACADADHDCSAYGGAKSGIEETPGPVEVEQPDELAAALDEHTAAVDAWLAAAVYMCRGCRLWMTQDAKLCGPCSALPSCGARRVNEYSGRPTVCIRPTGHDTQHEEVQGSAWGPDDCTPPPTPSTTPAETPPPAPSLWRRLLARTSRRATGGS